MPKLSQRTLEKRFHCPHCSATFRTRQGLSGHIQFKHSAGTVEAINSPEDWITEIPRYYKRSPDDWKSDTAMYKSMLEKAGLNKVEVSEITEILKGWPYIENLVEATLIHQNVKISGADFKTYMIVALAQMLANRRLTNQLNKDLSEAISKMIELQSNITAIIYKKYS